MSDLQQLATFATQYKQQYESNQISPSEFKELIWDLNIAKSINDNADNLADNEKYRQILLGVLQIVEAIY
jgi:hypothetical protein